MTEREIIRVRKKILLISTLSFVCVMLLMGGFIYLFSSLTVRTEALNILTFIAENDGDLPFSKDGDNPGSKVKPGPKGSAYTGENDEQVAWSLDNLFGMGSAFETTADLQNSARYFAVLFDQAGEVETIKTGHIASINEEQAVAYAEMALKQNHSFDDFGRYFYYVADRENGGKIVVYLDRSMQVTLMRRILVAALGLVAIGTLLAFLLMKSVSKQFVRKEIDNMEKQKQFITNASHELKTPLAVIRANTEMQEMLNGEDEWSRSTLRQVDRMSGLIENLVKISRAQETEGIDMKEIELSVPVRESAESFVSVASGEGKKLIIQAASPVTILADESRIRQLVSLLTDNAVKYCDANGTITVSLAKSGKGALLTVSNDYADGKEVDYSRFFERFYRQDTARTISDGNDENSSSKNGYGIGLSIAESLVKSMKGTINVNWKNGVISFVCKFS